MNKDDFKKLEGAIYGLAIGDALGVPYEFKKRGTFHCIDMRGFGTYLQPAGTFSDDTSLTLALLDAMCYPKGQPNIKKLASNLKKWMFLGKFSINHFTFDVGLTTRKSILKMLFFKNPIECGGIKENTKGNGSLMRILPLAFYLKNINDYKERQKWIYDICSMTHSTLECKIACHFFIEYAIRLINGERKINAYKLTTYTLSKMYSSDELLPFKRIFSNDIHDLYRYKIKSTGYVVSTLEAALWCFLRTDNYKDAILESVNLGGDTDTIASICGGLAGIYYGVDGIPIKWMKKLRGKKIINKILQKYKEATITQQY